MTISTEKKATTELSGNAKTRFGRIIVLASIATIIAIIVVFFFLSTPTRHHPLYLWMALIILTCCQLYMGSIWAKWVIGCILVLYGVSGIFILIPLSDINLNPLVVFLIFLTIASLVSGISLILSKSVLAFLNEQFADRSIVIIRVLKVLWMIPLLEFIIIFYNDIWIFFFSLL